jgi:hypothetical protein
VPSVTTSLLGPRCASMPKLIIRLIRARVFHALSSCYTFPTHRWLQILTPVLRFPGRSCSEFLAVAPPLVLIGLP